jgi:predicted Zn finger-like uncharacterized protein
MVDSMLIECPSCAAAYDLPEGSLSASGRKVRCAECKTIWLAYPPALAEEPRVEPEPEPEPEEDLSGWGLTAEDMGETATKAEPAESAEAADDADMAGWADPGVENSQDDIDSLFDDLPAEAEQAAEPAEVPVMATDMEKAAERPEVAEAREPPAADAALLGVGAVTAAAIAHLPAGEGDEVGSRKPSPLATETRVRRSRQMPIAAALALFACGLIGAMALYREGVVSAVPQTAKLFAAVGLPVNLRGVEIRNVSSKLAIEQGVPQLIVHGEIVNISGQQAKLARLRLAIRTDRGQEIYSWNTLPDKPVLEPGESAHFVRRLASPPEEGRDVIVRFEMRGDMVAGVQ